LPPACWQEPGVGYYVDGVYHARPATVAFDFSDIERIEVLRGPQGTLFGKNITAGAINIVLAAPSFTSSANVELSVGERRFVQARVSATGPLVGVLKQAGVPPLRHTHPLVLVVAAIVGAPDGVAVAVGEGETCGASLAVFPSCSFALSSYYSSSKAVWSRRNRDGILVRMLSCTSRAKSFGISDSAISGASLARSSISVTALCMSVGPRPAAFPDSAKCRPTTSWMR